MPPRIRRRRPAVRALLALLVDEGGIVARDAVAGPLAALDKDQRRAVTRLGVRIGALDLFMPAVLKPEAMRWRAALRAAAAGAADAGSCRRNRAWCCRRRRTRGLLAGSASAPPGRR